MMEDNIYVTRWEFEPLDLEAFTPEQRRVIEELEAAIAANPDGFRGVLRRALEGTPFEGGV